jgi:hypothetical protein
MISTLPAREKLIDPNDDVAFVHDDQANFAELSKPVRCRCPPTAQPERRSSAGAYGKFDQRRPIQAERSQERKATQTRKT